MILLKNYFFANILLPMLTAYICMMLNSASEKDNRIPNSPQENWKKDMLTVTNFLLIWAIITVFMQLYKAYLKYKWGI